MAKRPTFTTSAGAPIGDNQSSVTAAKTEMIPRSFTVAGELGAADAELDVPGFALKF
jgi:catalase